jgi:hypothetical protein
MIFLPKSYVYVGYRTVVVRWEAQECRLSGYLDFTLMNPTLHHRDVAPPWRLGPYLVYAPTLHAARLAYDYAHARPDPVASGTVALEAGETIEWTNCAMASSAIDSVM